MRNIFAVLTTSLLVACAATYEQPTSVAPQITSAISASKSDILRAAKQVLVSEGFQITNSDESAGIISSAPRNLRVSPAQANCGTTMGLDYLKDNRTSTRVAFGIIAENGKVTVKANIEGEYKPGAVDQDITLTCVSRGVLERDLLTKIAGSLSR